MADVTDADRELADELARIVGAIYDTEAIAQALADERERARAPFRAVADDLERVSELFLAVANHPRPVDPDAASLSGDVGEVLEDFAARIREAAE